MFGRKKELKMKIESKMWLKLKCLKVKEKKTKKNVKTQAQGHDMANV